MLHFSCDLCGHSLGDRRFVVTMEVRPAFDPEEFDEEDLDADHLQEISDLIAEMEINGKAELDDCSSKRYRYDLCPRCQQRFQEDPLGRNALRRLNFSQN